MAIPNTVTAFLAFLTFLLLFPSSIYCTITIETSRLLSGDDVRVFKDGQPGEAILKTSYIPVQISLVPLDGDRVEVIGGKHRLKFLHRQRNLADITVDAIPKRKMKVLTIRRMMMGGGKGEEAQG